ncbi:MAG: hypothetical protein JW719_06390 [Pirellulales bacterium]|nr:hypothetical protein [Pirellulales bacterium]
MRGKKPYREGWYLIAFFGLFLVTGPVIGQRPTGANVIRGVFRPPAVSKNKIAWNTRQPAAGVKVTQADLHLPLKYGINLPSGNNSGSGGLNEPNPISKDSPPPKQVWLLRLPPGHVPAGWPGPRQPFRPITSGQRPIDPNRYQGPLGWNPASGGAANPEPTRDEEIPHTEPTPQDLPPGTPDVTLGPDWPSIEDQLIDAGRVADSSPGVNKEASPAVPWPTDERDKEPVLAERLGDKIHAATEPEREWPSVDDGQVAFPESRLPNQKLETDAWTMPDKKGGTDDVNSLPEFGIPNGGLPDSETVESWGRYPKLENDDPLGGLVNPFGKGGTSHSSGPDFGPDAGRPDFGGRQGILNLGSFDPHMPKDDGSSGGAKDPFGGPGPLNTNKGPMGAGQVGQDKEKVIAKAFEVTVDGKVYVHIWSKSKFTESWTMYLSYDTDAKDVLDAADAGLADIVVGSKSVYVYPKKGPSGESIGDFLGLECEGPIDTGGDRPGPTSVDDLDKSKAAGVLVKDPAYTQGGAGNSGIDATKHPSHVSNPGYEGGVAKGGGIKVNRDLVTDPPETSGN